MTIMFNEILSDVGIDPVEVCLIRHKDKDSDKGRTPYELWKDDRSSFDLYQSIQNDKNRKILSSTYWAIFNVDADNKNIFAGLYSSNFKGLLEKDTSRPHKKGVDKAGECDVYDLKLQHVLSDLIGNLCIDWGAGARAWIQYANKNDKLVTENKFSFRNVSIKCHEFVNNDIEYLKWITANPHGIVINTLKGKPINNRVLHNASCSLITKLTGKEEPVSFTEREYIKICAPSFASLDEWSKNNENKSFSSKCGKCFPESQDEDEQDKVLSKHVAQTLSRQIADAAKLDKSSLLLKSEKFLKKPRVITSITKVFDRNPFVIVMALNRANGICELCGKNAPFSRRKDGTPYLEVHHKNRLADGGEDIIENVIAICPNCHRKQHFG